MSTKHNRYDSHFQNEWLTDYSSIQRKCSQNKTKDYCILCIKVVFVEKEKDGLD